MYGKDMSSHAFSNDGIIHARRSSLNMNSNTITVGEAKPQQTITAEKNQLNIAPKSKMPSPVSLR
jgi:hypothetical protein